MSVLYKLENIKRYYDEKLVLDIDELTLSENQIIGVFGPNGSGKSTLFSLLSMIEKPCSGHVYFNDKCQKTIDFKVKQDIVIVPQNPYLLKRTVFDNIAYGLKIRKDNSNLKEQVNEALSLVGLDESFASRNWSELSGGEAQRVALAARLILKPKVLILDEPTSAVDTNSAQLIKEAILKTKQKYKTTILISSHDHNWLNQICNKKIALFQGKIIKSGSVNLLFAPWEKDENSNLVKRFLDNQTLTIENSQSKKRDSVIMIDAKNIEICRVDCDEMMNKNTLKGKIDSIHQINDSDEILVEFIIGGIMFNCISNIMEIKNQNLLPSDDIYININTKDVCFI